MPGLPWPPPHPTGGFPKPGRPYTPGTCPTACLTPNIPWRHVGMPTLLPGGWGGTCLGRGLPLLPAIACLCLLALPFTTCLYNTFYLPVCQITCMAFRLYAMLCATTPTLPMPRWEDWMEDTHPILLPKHITCTLCARDELGGGGAVLLPRS